MSLQAITFSIRTLDVESDGRLWLGNQTLESDRRYMT